MTSVRRGDVVRVLVVLGVIFAVAFVFVGAGTLPAGAVESSAEKAAAPAPLPSVFKEAIWGTIASFAFTALALVVVGQMSRRP
ncbi:hypothetical protein [Austwickia chelonae]|uniref:hypothetical protein n=1 Tax=Austwickia chelonae TaxID=100225 RepID=UPI0013C301A8|nr:hypothetical protein [Austwickia chelonae]